MPVIYYDKGAEKERASYRHPSWELNKDHPCYKIERFASEGKSVFRWTHEQALEMYDWIVEGYNANMEDEFGKHVSSYDFEKIICESYFLTEQGDVSGFTIKEAWEAQQMQERLEEEENEE